MLRHAFSNPKLAELAMLLELPRYAVVGVLEHLWYFTATQAPRGDVGRWSNRQIAASIDWRGDPEALIEALIETRWIDRSEEHRLVVHDWSQHCDQNVRNSPRVKKDGFAYAAPMDQYCANTAPRDCPTPDSCLPTPEPEPEELPSADEPPARPRLLNLLSKQRGTEAEKAAWLERELPLLEAEHCEGKDPPARRVIGWWRAHVKRHGLDSERAARAEADAARQRELAAFEAEELDDRDRERMALFGGNRT